MDNETSFVNIYQELLKNRIIYVSGPIDDESANTIVAELLYLESLDPDKDIFMYLNSPGGVITSGLAIFDTMNLVKPDIVTIVVGQAASMASFLLAAGTKGKRYALPNSSIMIHQPLGGVQGQTTDILIHAEEIKRIRKQMNTYYAEFTGKSYKQICQDTERDNFLTAKQAVEYGLVDKIMTNTGDDVSDEN